MSIFFRYLSHDTAAMVDALKDTLAGLSAFFMAVFDFEARYAVLQAYDAEFTMTDWVLLLVLHLLVLVLVVFFFVHIKSIIAKLFRFKVSVKDHAAALKQLEQLQRDLLRANLEKDKLLGMQISALGDTGASLDGEEGEEGATPLSLNRNTFESAMVNPSDSRFFRLTEVDNRYKAGDIIFMFDDSITLETFCDQFRKYAASQLKLYYDISMIRQFIASLGTARIIILQGISGTGKTSLPYAFGRYIAKDAAVVSVQPAWRERTELYGYFNEFTKKYTETDFLRAIYEANYFRDPQMVILDEMNIARVEYYFAEMLSILEMPRQEEWLIDIVTAMWENDPCLIHQGKVQIPNNVWFVGTINNDDSTFAVADKVYDRAIPIDLDSRAEHFTCEWVDQCSVSTDRLNELFDEAKATYQISPEVLDQIEQLNTYLINHFKLAFGNRILKQLNDYVPCYIACGGTEIEAVDFMVAKKVLRKFESLSLGFMKEELSKFTIYLDKVFGKDNMKMCKAYIEVLKATN